VTPQASRRAVRPSPRTHGRGVFHPASAHPSNRQVATAAGISDQGQISKLLARLQALGLVGNAGGDHAKGEPNAWALTPQGRDVTRTLQAQTSR